MDGKENLFELGLGIYCKCGDGIWLKTIRDVSAGEELLMCYSKVRTN